jgi:geranylgeranyl diphosphate synthase type II
MRYSLLAPGKRLRPALVLSSAEACGGSLESAIPAAIAVEMIHAYSLVHDDLPAMDDDDLRRGRPTTHIAFDEATAILVGDALQARAFEVLATGLAPSIAGRACAILARIAGPRNLVGGQADDLAAEKGALEPTIELLEGIHLRKTAALLVGSLELGALTAQATNLQTEALIDFGKNLGLAFQIVDDLLDATGTAETVGKRTGKDAARGKLTYPALLGVEPSRIRAGELISRARKSLELFGSRAFRLNWLAGYVLDRSK